MSKNKTNIFENLSNEFFKYESPRHTTGTINSYRSYLNSVEDLAGNNDTSLVDWLNDLTSNSIYKDPTKSEYIDPLICTNRRFELLTSATSVNKRKKWKVVYKHFMEFHLGQYFGHIWLFKNLPPTQLCKMVAESAIFASPDVVKDVVNGKLGTKKNKKGGCSKVNQCQCSDCKGEKGNPYASWDHCVHARDNNVKKGNSTTDCNGLPSIADDNTNANKYTKDAIKEKYKQFGLIGTGKFSDYVACHIWDNPNDCHYYASIANLVLVPHAIYGLTDHCDEVKAVLRLQAKKRFGKIATLPKMDDNEEEKAKKINKDLHWRGDKIPPSRRIHKRCV